MKLAAIILDTFREGFARKTIIAFLSIATLVLVVAFFIFLIMKNSILSPVTMTQGTQKIVITAEQIMQNILLGIASLVYAPAILLSIFATASIVPNTMEKGSIDLLLSKPISRLELLAGKFIGGTVMVLACIAYYLIGMTLIVGFLLGHWTLTLFWTILPMTLSFAVLYSLSILLGVLSRSSALPIITSYFLFILVIPALASRDQLFAVIQNATLTTVLDGLYYFLPKTSELGRLSEVLIQNQAVDWMPIWSSALFGAACFVGALWVFRKKDF